MFKEGDIIKMKVVKFDGNNDECRLKCPFGDECGQRYYPNCIDVLDGKFVFEKVEEE